MLPEGIISRADDIFGDTQGMQFRQTWQCVPDMARSYSLATNDPASTQPPPSCLPAASNLVP